MYKIVRMYRSAKKILPPNLSLLVVVNGQGKAIECQYSRHQAKAYDYNWYYLFFNLLNKPIISKGKSISSFFVRKSIYFAFFRSTNISFQYYKSGPRDNKRLGPIYTDLDYKIASLSGDSNIIFPNLESEITS